MEFQPLHYKVIYRNGDRIPVEIADFWRTETGEFVFAYLENAKYEFPGFDKANPIYKSNSLWEQISFRIPVALRTQFPNTPPEELLKNTEGKLVTDHFEFQFTQVE